MIIVSPQWKQHCAYAIDATISNTGFLRIYKGTKPTNVYTTPFLATTHSANLLLTLNVNNNTMVTSGATWILSVVPPTAAASATGTATWACYQNGTANNPTDYVIGDVTLNTGNGLIVMTTLNLISGTSYTIAECSLTFA